jgi:hypothetical protein
MEQARERIYALALEGYSRMWQALDSWDTKAGQMIAFGAGLYGLFLLNGPRLQAWPGIVIGALIIGAMVLSLIAWWLLAGAHTFRPKEWQAWLSEMETRGFSAEEIQRDAFDSMMNTLSAGYEGMRAGVICKGRLVRWSAILIAVAVLLQVLSPYLLRWSRGHC